MKPKLAYLLYLSIENQRGVWQKILDQSTMLSDHFDIRIYVLSPNNSDAQIDKSAHKFKISVSTYNSRFDQIIKILQVAEAINEFQPSGIYFRYGTYFPIFELLFRRYPTVIELNSNSRVEIKTQNIIKNMFHTRTAERIYRLASGFVAVTDEIKSQYSIYNKPSMAIGNGIDLSRITPLETHNDPIIRLAFMGSPGARWHGVEDIISAAASAFSKFDFDIIGYTKDEFPHATENVHFHGYLNPDQYRIILSRATVAIGSLALYKNDMQQGSTLKAREYLALGLPTILGHSDVDFPEQVEYILTVPNCPGAFGESRPQVEEFISKWRGRRIERGLISNLDTQIKENARAQFIQTIIQRR